MKRTFYFVPALALFGFALCETLQLGASETTLLNENFAAIARSAGPGGPGGGGDYPDGPGGGPVNPPDSPFLRGYRTDIIWKTDIRTGIKEKTRCCVPSCPTDGCDFSVLNCIGGGDDPS